MGHLDNLIGAFTGGGAPRANVWVVAAPLLLQLGTVTVLIREGTRVGCVREKNIKNIISIKVPDNSFRLALFIS